MFNNAYWVVVGEFQGCGTWLREWFPHWGCILTSCSDRSVTRSHCRTVDDVVRRIWPFHGAALRKFRWGDPGSACWS